MDIHERGKLANKPFAIMMMARDGNDGDGLVLVVKMVVMMVGGG